MAMFDSLPDLALIEIFKYLSSVEILWSFSCLNDRLTALLIERSCFRQVNLSFAQRRQFDSLVDLLPLNEIESLIIDGEASILQLRRWPHLPRLTTLRLMGIWNSDDVSTFVLLHASTLTHLKLEPMEHFINIESDSPNRPYPISGITRLLGTILRHLTGLQSLDLGNSSEFAIYSWPVVSFPICLSYLRLSLGAMIQLFLILSTRRLSSTLRELHVTMRDYHFDDGVIDWNRPYELSPMVHLSDFSFVKPFFSNFDIEWEIIESVTRPYVMPVLRRINLAIVIEVNDLDNFRRSEIFVDHRRIDVQFALNLVSWEPEMKPSEIVLPTSRFHPRQIISATALVNDHRNIRPDNSSNITSNITGRPCHPVRHHLWYTLPWTFDDFFELDAPISHSIIKVEVFDQCPQVMHNKASRLRTMVASGEILPPAILDFPHVVQLDRIFTLQFFFCSKPIDLILPVLRHVTLIDSRNLSTIFSSLPATVRSLDILLCSQPSPFVVPDWSGLHLLRSLPLFNSLLISLYDMETAIDQASCQIIAQAVTKLGNFAFFFRPKLINDPLSLESMLTNQRTCIDELRHRILLLSVDEPPFHLVESGGCGLAFWFD